MSCCFIPKDMPAFRSHFSFNRNQFSVVGEEKKTHEVLSSMETIHKKLVDDYSMPSSKTVKLNLIEDWHPMRDRFSEIGFNGRMVEILFDGRVLIGWLCDEIGT